MNSKEARAEPEVKKEKKSVCLFQNFKDCMDIIVVLGPWEGMSGSSNGRKKQLQIQRLSTDFECWILESY
jgi:hypothetical protein